ncbi:hypothetical protein [Xenorhabdus bovienii]|uniref:hypothetical protein n=1 Tax=Xenorhabdus bovienii TaxID=40576 RepID=UPI000A95AC26|nr:hypothetical protein [Xenorhabdus bovienii]
MKLSATYQSLMTNLTILRKICDPLLNPNFTLYTKRVQFVWMGSLLVFSCGYRMLTKE